MKEEKLYVRRYRRALEMACQDLCPNQSPTDEDIEALVSAYLKRAVAQEKEETQDAN